jgi:hypothetical protein
VKAKINRHSDSLTSNVPGIRATVCFMHGIHAKQYETLHSALIIFAQDSGKVAASGCSKIFMMRRSRQDPTLLKI